MSSYRKRPVVIEAFRFDPAACGRELPGGIQGIPAPGADNWDYEGARFWIHTLEGDMIVSPGDWIITGVKGERYPCKPDIFELTYEPTDTPAPQPPAADPHDGWFVLLKDGCAMPKNGATVDVTVGNEENDRWVERCSYLPSARGAPGLHGFDLDLYEGEFLVAWRAAPKPFRGGV